jgi:molybdopterin-guanine dinucleotide biosynthesis protein A
MIEPIMKRAAVVLCGGKSSRMGRAKAWLPWFGKPMIEHVVGVLRPVVDEVVVVTSKAVSLPPLDARIVEDREAELGPLAGIREGLQAAGSHLAFVTSTDSPFLTAEHVVGMLERGSAVAPAADGHVQVLSAVYPGSAWKEADDLLRNGKRRPLALLERLGFESIEVEMESGGKPAPWQGFNRPDEYLFWARAIDPDAKACVELLGRAALAVGSRQFESPIGTLGEVLGGLALPDSLGLIEEGQLSKSFLASVGGRDLVRRLDLPVGPGERVSVIDALAGG